MNKVGGAMVHVYDSEPKGLGREFEPKSGH